ncbi:MAG: glutathione S-transferase [Hyphomicrobiales bacterium]|nr:glutathione S-transferase [Hyphomicrobiales bacterium]
MAEFKLHCFAQSGNAYKSALMLACCEADWEAVWIDFFNGQTRKAEWRDTVNEMGEAPVLEHGGKKLTQSGVINAYLSKHFKKLGAENDDEELEVLRWTLFDNHKLSGVLGPYRFLNVLMPTAPDPAVMNFLKGRLDAAFAVLEVQLGRQPFVALDRPTIADLSCAGYVFYPADELNFDFKADYPNISAWMDRLKELPGWKPPYEMMPGEIFRAQR